VQAVPFCCAQRGGYPSWQHCSPPQQNAPPQETGAAPPSGTFEKVDTPLQQVPVSQCPEQHCLSLAHMFGPSRKQVWHDPPALQKSVPQHSWWASQVHPVDAQHA
jgi:hypothetical protein